MKRIAIALCAFAAAALCGCLPEKRVVWSPDGRWAVVRGGDGLYLCDEQGKLSPRLVEETGPVAWLPDSRRLVVPVVTKVRTWAELKRLLDAQRVRELEPLGEKLLAETLAYAGDWEQFKPTTAEGQTGGVLAALLLYVRDKGGAALRQKLGERAEDLEKLEAAITRLHIATLRDQSLDLGHALLTSLDTISGPCVSPDGKNLSYLLPLPGDNSPQAVYVVPVDGSAPPRCVAEQVCSTDWSPDGRYLVYAASSIATAPGGDQMRLGVVARRRVCDEHGNLLEALPDAEDLVGIMFRPETRVVCLRDGRIVFASIDVHLPSTAKDMPQRPDLFAIDCDRQPTVTRLTPRQTAFDLPDALHAFALSPDQRHVCVPSKVGRVAVLTLASGELWEIAGDKDVDELRTLPTWRSNDELCLNYGPAAGQPGARSEIVLAKLDWKEKKVTRTSLSRDWPAAVVEGFLIKKSEDQPASQPAQKP